MDFIAYENQAYGTAVILDDKLHLTPPVADRFGYAVYVNHLKSKAFILSVKIGNIMSKNTDNLTSLIFADSTLFSTYNRDRLDFQLFDRNTNDIGGLSVQIDSKTMTIYIEELQTGKKSSTCSLDPKSDLDLKLVYSSNTMSVSLNNTTCTIFTYVLEEYLLVLKSYNGVDAKSQVVLSDLQFINQDQTFSKDLKKLNVKKAIKASKEDIGVAKTILMKTHPLETQYYTDDGNYWDVDGIAQINIYVKVLENYPQRYVNYMQFVDYSGNTFNCPAYNEVNTKKFDLKKVDLRDKKLDLIHMIYMDTIQEIHFKYTSKGSTTAETLKIGDTGCKMCKGRRLTFALPSKEISKLKMSCNIRGVSNLQFAFHTKMAANSSDLIRQHAHNVAEGFIKNSDANATYYADRYSGYSAKQLAAVAMAQNELIDNLAYKSSYFLSHYDEYLDKLLNNLTNTRHRTDDLYNHHHDEKLNKSEVPSHLDPRSMSHRFAKEYSDLEDLKKIIQTTVEGKFKSMETRFDLMRGSIHDKLRLVSDSNRELWIRQKMGVGEGSDRTLDLILFGVFAFSNIFLIFAYSRHK